ncbi:MAG: hypothetical protein CMG39_02810 [Candidatus Marinimicrobia bacterium]|nr:hypothetical protein [Candidatus Neomarinimicrobiota bacterium]
MINSSLNTENIQIYSFYRFIKIKNKKKTKLLLNRFLKNKIIKGTILIADEGINASISGTKDSLNDAIIHIKDVLNIRKINLKINDLNYIPFNKFKIRLKKEIVSLGINHLHVSSNSKNYVHPKEWDKFISKRKVKIIDTRNTYEIKIGKFNRAINPNTKTFREFPLKIQNLDIKKNDTIAMYCTGGIRCEKASTLLKLKGFKNIHLLEGGIINYLENKKNNNSKTLWKGECFVFDKRVTVNKKLSQGKYLQCYGCRMPITKKDTQSSKYKKGVSCHHCYDLRSPTQKKNSEVRQKQIEMKKLNKT